MIYRGGPVMHSEKTYPIFWDPGHKLKSKTKSLISRYLKDTAHDSGKTTNVYSVLSQYTDGSGHAAYKQRFGGAFTDTHAYPKNDPNCLAFARYSTAWPPDTHCLDQSQIATELSRFIASRSLSTGMSSVYFIVTPSNVPVCNKSDLCATIDFCGFHDHVGSGRHAKLYALIPMTDNPDMRYAKGCGHPDGGAHVQEPNDDIGDVAINVISHELSETITDPLYGSGTSGHEPNQPAWLSGFDEVADKCQATGPASRWHDPHAFKPTLGGTASKGTLYDQLINGHRYYTQSDWSNKDGACKMRSGHG